MGRSTLERRADIAARAADWVEAGLISDDQARSIRRFEAAADTREGGGAPSTPAGALTMVAEVAGYLSGVVAVLGGIAIVGPRWSGLTFAARLSIALVIAVIGFVVGGRCSRSDDRAAARLGGFVWVIAAGGLALAAGVLADRLDVEDDRWVAVSIGTIVAVAGVGLWRNLDRPLQLATTAVGVIVAAGALGDVAGVPPWVAALVAWVAGASLGGAVALGGVHPRTTGFVVAAAVMVIGAFQLAAQFERASAVLAVSTAALIVTIALVERSLPLLGVGLVSFVAAVSLLFSTVVEGTLGRSIAVVVGLIALSVVGARAQRRAAG